MARQLARLRRRADFLRTAAAGRKCAMPGLVLQVMHRSRTTAGDGGPRVGFTASRRVGGAVQRNRARRRLRAAAAAILPAAVAGAIDLVLIARAATLKQPFAALLSDLATALKRTGAVAGNAAGTGRS